MSQNDVARICEKLETLQTTVERMDRRLNGPADEPEKGMVVRLDRVEQWKARAQKVQWLLMGAAVTFFASRLLDVL